MKRDLCETSEPFSKKTKMCFVFLLLSSYYIHFFLHVFGTIIYMRSLRIHFWQCEVHFLCCVGEAPLQKVAMVLDSVSSKGRTPLMNVVFVDSEPV